jgi:thiamine phosphate synthase YjbQ (UPF0047 family)
MKVVSIGPDGFALKIASRADHVASLTPEELEQNDVSADLLSTFERYAKKVSSMTHRPESPDEDESGMRDG